MDTDSELVHIFQENWHDEIEPKLGHTIQNAALNVLLILVKTKVVVVVCINFLLCILFYKNIKL